MWDKFGHESSMGQTLGHLVKSRETLVSTDLMTQVFNDVLMNKQWFTYLVHRAEDFTTDIIDPMNQKRFNAFVKVKEDIVQCKNIVPGDLRICGTYLTAVSVLIPNSNNITHTHVHVDRNNVTPRFLYLGNNGIGGDLMFLWYTRKIQECR